MESELNRLIWDAEHSLDSLCEALVKIAEAATTATEAITNAFSALGCFALGDTLRRYATPRQWYLLNHGSPKVRKKWKNALLRKARVAGKRCAR